MIRKFFAVATIALLASVLVAQDAKSVTVTGYLIDNACGSHHAGDKTFGKDHSVSCSKMEACEKSGYAVNDEGRVYKLDQAGNELASSLLDSTKATKGLKVKVEGTVDGDTIKVTKLTEVVADTN